MAIFAVDSLNDAEDVTIQAHTPSGGGTWTKHPTAATELVFRNNRLGTHLNARGSATHSGTPAGPNQYAEATIRKVGTGGVAGVTFRGDGTARTHYLWRANGGAGRYELYRFVAGTGTLLGTYSVAITDETDYVIRGQAVGSSIQGYVDGVLRVAVGDTAITATGLVGVDVESSHGDTTGIHLDNFSAGDVPAVATIADHRTGYLNGTTSGWAARSLHQKGADTYLVALDTTDNKIAVFKSTAGGAFSELDAANAPTHSAATHSYDAYLRGNDLSVFYRTATNTGRVRVFDTTTDTWSALDIGGANVSTAIAADRGVSLITRSDGDVLVLFSDTGDADVKIAHFEGSAWATTLVQALLSAAPGIHGSAINATDAMRFVYQAVSTNSKHGSFTAANAASQSNLDTSTLNLFASFPGVADDAGTARVAYLIRDSGGELDFNHDTFTDTEGALAIVGGVSPTSVTDPGIMGGAVVAYDNKWHVIWSGDGRGEVHMDTSDDYATPAFGTDATLVSGLVGTDPAVYATVASTGVVVAYTDLDGPDVGILWAIGQPPEEEEPEPEPDPGAVTSSLFIGLGASL